MGKFAFTENGMSDASFELSSSQNYLSVQQLLLSETNVNTLGLIVCVCNLSDANMSGNYQ